MILSIVIGPKFIQFLRRNEFGQHIREEGPSGHVVKQGTPTMGGLLIMASMFVPFLVFSERTLEALTVFFVTLGWVPFMTDSARAGELLRLMLGGGR